MAWDVEGELTRVFEGSSTVGEYVYTADGDRLVRREGGVTTVYLPGGQEVSRVDATGELKALRYYTFNGKTIAVRSGSGYAGVTSLVSDPHATAEIAIDNGTNELTRRYLDPYGNDQGATGNWIGDHGFLNKPVDATGLVAIGARYYDPGIGRFISVDPVMTLTDPQQWAAYSYANNNPITYWDPTGLWPDWLDDAASTVTDAVSTAWDNTTEWVDEHQADIVAGVVGVVTYATCTGATLGGGAVLCGVVAGAASGAASNMWRTHVEGEEFSWGSLAYDVGMGAATGLVTAQGGQMLNNYLRIGPYLPQPTAAPVAAGVTQAATSAAPRGSAFSSLTHSNLGIQPYSALRPALRGTGDQVHHLIEQRFLRQMGGSTSEWLSVGVTRAEHQVFTNAWRRAIPYNNSGSMLRTSTATRAQILAAARGVYAGYPEIRRALGLH